MIWVQNRVSYKEAPSRLQKGPVSRYLTTGTTDDVYQSQFVTGGKDSTVLAYVMKLLNERYNYGLNLVLLSVDEGITGYRDDSLETVKRNKVG